MNQALFRSYHYLTKKSQLRTLSIIRAGVSDSQISQLQENVILVNEHDEVVGPATKQVSHERKGNLTLLHRAFSVFLFNKKRELLLQQRSESKITFPNFFTNTCCSHQRYEKDEINGDLGTKVAAQRRMEFELGIILPQDYYQLLTKVHYHSTSDGDWAEHEMDHVLVAVADVDLSNVNLDEVKRTLFLSKDGLKEFMKDAEKNRTLITPWFRYITENLLYTWWDNLDNIENFKDGHIHQVGYLPSH